ncbi:hypothetical protein GCM10007939_19960 [Amylibacter marinus]|uniref:Glutathione S-transferase n=1 Tax=Amylibacter marinus TaxID=1475483 RepID=A0ABQ5VX97_9RHOB|nr:glutathione S-transferase family protein [Amylibacter marinus]GLQ35713.1 hypothetical protein GCM10007939_19960 [Amylibacter marinus]
MELIAFPPTYSEPAGSPFATKSMLMLEHSGLDYTITYLPDPRKMPKQKLPVLRAGTRLIPDSTEIQSYVETTHGIDFDKGLSDTQRATSTALIRMIEEHMYFILYASRWIDETNWQITKGANFGAIPKLIRGFIVAGIRKAAIQQLMGQGMGRHSEAEQMARLHKDLTSLSTLLGDQQYFFGDTPTSVDFSAVAFLNFMLNFPIENTLTEKVKSFPSLVAYAKSGRTNLYPEKFRTPMG